MVAAIPNMHISNPAILHSLYVGLPEIDTVDFQMHVSSGQKCMAWDTLRNYKISGPFISSLNLAVLSCFFCSGH